MKTADEADEAQNIKRWWTTIVVGVAVAIRKTNNPRTIQIVRIRNRPTILALVVNETNSRGKILRQIAYTGRLISVQIHGDSWKEKKTRSSNKKISTAM
jgi:hypothetical protein